MFRIVATANNIKYIRRTLRPEGNFVKMHYEQRPWILFFAPSIENENEAASLLINLTDRGFVIKFVYWNEGPNHKAEEEAD